MSPHVTHKQGLCKDLASNRSLSLFCFFGFFSSLTLVYVVDLDFFSRLAIVQNYVDDLDLMYGGYCEMRGVVKSFDRSTFVQCRQ